MNFEDPKLRLKYVNNTPDEYGLVQLLSTYDFDSMVEDLMEYFKATKDLYPIEVYKRVIMSHAMKICKGTANPKMILEVIERKL